MNAMFAISLTPLIGLLKDIKLAAPERLKERYQESVNQLATIDPLLAYQLSGRPQTDFNNALTPAIDWRGDCPDSLLSHVLIGDISLPLYPNFPNLRRLTP